VFSPKFGSFAHLAVHFAAQVVRLAIEIASQCLVLVAFEEKLDWNHSKIRHRPRKAFPQRVQYFSKPFATPQ